MMFATVVKNGLAYNSGAGQRRNPVPPPAESPASIATRSAAARRGVIIFRGREGSQESSTVEDCLFGPVVITAWTALPAYGRVSAC